MTAVLWRAIPAVRGYEVSSTGRVASTKKWRGSVARRELVGGMTKGYPTVLLYQSGVRSTRYVHDLVLLAFVGPKPPGMVVRHLDGTRWNNTTENLTYGTPSENTLDSVRHGTHPSCRRRAQGSERAA